MSHEFTDEDKAFLKRYYSTKGAEWCAAKLERHTKHSIKTKANKMGLKLTPEAKRIAKAPAALAARKAREQRQAQEALAPIGLADEYLQAPSIWRVAQRFASEGRWQA